MEPQKLWDGIWVIPGDNVGWAASTAVEAANEGSWEQAPVTCHGGDEVRIGIRRQKTQSMKDLSPDSPAHDWLRLFAEYGREVARACGVEVGEVRTADFIKSEPGDYFVWHRDAERNAGAALTVLIYLTDASDGLVGGETEFLVGEQDNVRMELRPEKGMAAAFLPWTSHRGAEIAAGVKYMVQVVYEEKK